MRKLAVLLSIALLCLVAALVMFAPALFDANNAVADWQPAVAAAMPVNRQPRAGCAEQNPLKNAYFGDLHIHTALSMDARSRDMLGTPAAAYQFARGEQTGLGPFNANGEPSRPRQLARPLDFAAVTDHAEWIGEIYMCTTPGTKAYDTEDCKAYRGEEGARFSGIFGLTNKARMFGLRGLSGRKELVCGDNASWCRDTLKQAWQLTQAATEAANDTGSDCQFSAFHGWEFSDGPGMAKVHRNVIFRNSSVPELPVSSFETAGPFELWRKLDELCKTGESGCEALTIPHNSNMSNGRMFTVGYRDETMAEQQRRASLTARYDRLVEVMQIKGESECKAGLWNVLGEDEQCNFEKMRGLGEQRPDDCRNEIGNGAVMGLGCQSRLDFARYALIEGMAEQQRIGVNPYRFGLVGSTDTHNATPGDTSEQNYEGCCANTDTTPEQRLSTKRGFAGKGPVDRNPGGLMGVWAPQNTRDDLFDAMQAREVFATSGPRIQPRLFAGTAIPANACDSNPVAVGYANGVPMGGELQAPVNGQSPVFLAMASADAGTAQRPGSSLQRLQMIKVWHDDEGRFHQKVHDIAGHADNGASVELRTCAQQVPEASARRQFCTTWQDPDFNQSPAAAYYLRVLENPSCRWSQWHCISQPQGQRSAVCDDPAIPSTIQERAWSSPVWVN